MFPILVITRVLHSIVLITFFHSGVASDNTERCIFPVRYEQHGGAGISSLPGKAQDCCDLQLLTGVTRSGVYNIYPFDDNKERPVKVFCDFETNGGGWTVLQRREEVRGPIDRFYRNWKNYEDGFGSLDYSHWIGLQNIGALTGGLDQMVRFELEDWEGDSRYAEYERFSVGDKQGLYLLNVENYTGTAGDSLTRQNGMPFSTHDRDNDKSDGNCALLYKGGWWYDECHVSNINGLYVVNGSHTTYADGVNWSTFRGYQYALKRVEMKIRNRNFPNGCFPLAATTTAKVSALNPSVPLKPA